MQFEESSFEEEFYTGRTRLIRGVIRGRLAEGTLSELSVTTLQVRTAVIRATISIKAGDEGQGQVWSTYVLEFVREGRVTFRPIDSFPENCPAIIAVDFA